VAKADVLYCYYQRWLDNCKTSIVWLRERETLENAKETATKIADYQRMIPIYEKLLTEELTWEQYCEAAKKGCL